MLGCSPSSSLPPPPALVTFALPSPSPSPSPRSSLPLSPSTSPKPNPLLHPSPSSPAYFLLRISPSPHPSPSTFPFPFTSPYPSTSPSLLPATYIVVSFLLSCCLLDRRPVDETCVCSMAFDAQQLQGAIPFLTPPATDGKPDVARGVTCSTALRRAVRGARRSNDSCL